MLAYKRTQVLLEPWQHQYLSDQAAKMQQSISALIRSIIDRDAKSQDNSKVQLRQQRLTALEQLTKFREEKFKREKHIYDGDIVQQMRDERDADIDRVLRGEE